jgi:hypothetical protein
MRPGEHLLEVRQTRHHSNNMVLDVSEIKADIHPRSDFVVCIASLGKSSKNVGFAAQKFH